MGLRPTQANENGFHQFFCPFLTELSSRPERSAVEGPAVQRTSPENVFRQSEAQWRDLLFSGPLLRMFFDRADPDFLLRTARNDHACGSP
jgi:hypothetical protein